MIINFLITTIAYFSVAVMSVLPVVTISNLPVIGSTVSDLLLEMVQYYNGAVYTIPYLGDMFTVFVYLVLPFELTLLVLRFILGNRDPVA